MISCPATAGVGKLFITVGCEDAEGEGDGTGELDPLAELQAVAKNIDNKSSIPIATDLVISHSSLSTTP